jgi:voltage-gated potassium channel
VNGQLTRFTVRRLTRAFETGRILPYLLTTIAVMALAFAVLIRIADPKSFPSFGLALWWSVSTVTTVGYGDVVPEQPLGRLVASVLMIIGFGSLSLLTGIVASLLVSRSRGDRLDRALETLDRIDGRLEELERRVPG